MKLRHELARFAAAPMARDADNTRAALHLARRPDGDRSAPLPASPTRQQVLAARHMVRTAARDIHAARDLVRALRDGRRSAALKAAVRRALRDYPELASYVRRAERLADYSASDIRRRLAAGRRRDAERDAALAAYARRQKGRKTSKRRAADYKSDDQAPASGGTPPKTSPASQPRSRQGSGKATPTPKRTTS